jgi:hypothetical protein
MGIRTALQINLLGIVAAADFRKLHFVSFMITKESTNPAIKFLKYAMNNT